MSPGESLCVVRFGRYELLQDAGLASKIVSKAVYQ